LWDGGSSNNADGIDNIHLNNVLNSRLARIIASNSVSFYPFSMFNYVFVSVWWTVFVSVWWTVYGVNKIVGYRLQFKWPFRQTLGTVHNRCTIWWLDPNAISYGGGGIDLQNLKWDIYFWKIVKKIKKIPPRSCVLGEWISPGTYLFQTAHKGKNCITQVLN
jgi:hypothetical protein